MKYEKSRKNVNIKPLKSRNEEDVERILENSRSGKSNLLRISKSVTKIWLRGVVATVEEEGRLRNESTTVSPRGRRSVLDSGSKRK